MTTPKNRGVMGPWFYSAGDAAIKGKIAYDDAQRQVAMGVNPVDAQRHAVEAGVWVTWGKITLFGAWCWLAVLLIVSMATLWAVPIAAVHGFLTFSVSQRLRQWREDRADTVREYDLPTTGLVVLWFFWGFFGWLIMAYTKAIFDAII